MTEIGMETKRKVRNLRRGEEKKHFEMLNLCFSPWGSEEKWTKLYRQPNFDTNKNVIIVEENGEWIGGVTAWFREAVVSERRIIKVCIAGDGYVHPSHRGKGVYSTFMRSVNELAQKNGASLGFGFISVNDVPFIALPKYGYIDVFYPVAKILILNPERFFQYLITRIQDVSVPGKFEGIKIELIVSINSVKGKFVMAKKFQIKEQKLCELTDTNSKEIDLQISTDIGLLFRIVGSFYLSKKTALMTLLVALLQRRFRVRFSIRFLKLVLGL